MKNVDEYIHLVVIFLSPILIVISFSLGIHKEILEFIVIPLALLLSIWLLIRGSYTNKEEEIHLFRTFLHDRIYSTNLGRPLVFNSEIFIIEAQERSRAFYTAFKRAFYEEVRKNNLILKSFDWDQSGDIEHEKKLREELKSKKSVIIVRTKELESKPFVYEAVEEWATRHPEAPCIYIKSIADADCKSEIPNNYFWMHDDPKSVPWGLLQRSGARSFAWRMQASFNKLIWKHTAILLAIFLSILAYNLLEDQRLKVSAEKDHQKELERIAAEHQRDQDERRIRVENRLKEQQSEYFQFITHGSGVDLKLVTEIRDGIARRMADLIENSVLNRRDDKLFVSYWLVDVNQQKPLRQVGTSDPHSARSPWGKNTDNLVGCAFSYENHFVEWDGQTVRVFAVGGPEKPDNKCAYDKRLQDTIKSMVCLAVNKSSDPRDATGVCIKTEPGTDTILPNFNYRDLLAERVTDFYQRNSDMKKSANKKAP